MATMTTASAFPRPKRRLWRTFFKRPRDLTPFLTPIPFSLHAAKLPSLDEAAHWGEVILVEDQLTVLHRDGTTSWRSHYVSMMHHDQILAQWDQVTKYYNRRIWKPTLKTAVVHTPEGMTYKAAVTDQQLDASGQNRVLNVSFGHMRPGVVLEYEEQEDHFVPWPVGPCLWGNFYLRTAPPCRKRRYTVAVAEPFEVEVKLHHDAEEPEEFTAGEYRVYQWYRENCEGIEWDAWTPLRRDFGPWIDVSTVPSWDAIADVYRMELLQTSPSAVRDLARNLTRNAHSAREKVAAVFQYASRDVRYGRPPSELSIRLSRTAAKMAEDLRGDCKDKSSLMVAILRACDIEAAVVVVLTRPQGLTPFLPSQRYDHALVVCKVDGEEIWLDPAAGPYTFGDVPYNDQGIRGVVLGDGDCNHVQVPPSEPHHHGATYEGSGALTPEGGLRFRSHYEARGDRAASLRVMLLDRAKDFQDRTVKQSVAQDLPGARVSEIEIHGLEDVNDTFGYDYTIELERWAQPIEKLLVLRIPWAEPALYQGPLVAEQRVQPLAPPLVQTVRERLTLEVPPGFAAYGLPHERREECPWAAYHCTIRLEDGKLVCERQLLLRGGIVYPEHFDEFKRFWAACVWSDAADVVLMKQG
jgi:hypothetical protein